MLSSKLLTYFSAISDYCFLADRMKSDTGGWVENTKAMEEYS